MKLISCLLNLILSRTFLLVNSPFQFLCLIEYLNKKKLDTNIVFVGYCSTLSQKQIIEINNTFNTNLKIFFLDELFNIKVFHIILYILKKIKRKFILCVSGTFKYYLFKEFIKKSKRVILIDEGFDVISILNNKKIIKANKYNFFSFLNNQNDFSYMRNYFQVKKVVNNKLVYCLGTNMFNNDPKKILEHLNNICKKFKGRKIIYFPHRTENFINLKKEILDIKVVNEPIEIYMCKSKILPKIVCGFYSTALSSINILFKDYNLNICNINFNIDYMKIEKRSYEYSPYKQHMLYSHYLIEQGIKNFY